MSTLIDLDAYFRRIGYDGERDATLATLRALHLQHAVAIAYENLNPLLRWPMRLDLPSLEQKLIRDGRGGYCYEHNVLFMAVLQALGFEVTGLAARVLWNRPENLVTPRTHMVLLVHIDGAPYIADVGFGGQTADRRYVLRDNELTVHHHASGVTERRTFTRAAELLRVLEHELRIRLPDSPELGAMLTRIVDRPGEVNHVSAPGHQTETHARPAAAP